jgi:hypothetical protein
MAIKISGDGSITGISTGGLPDGTVDTDTLAANAVTEPKLGADEASGLAKAWVNFNGTGTVAIRSSYNVSSITDNGIGNYVVNFTTAMPDANYTFIGAVSNTIDDWTTEYSGPSRGPTGLEQDGLTAPTSSAIGIETRYGSSGTSNGAVSDIGAVYVAIFR